MSFDKHINKKINGKFLLILFVLCSALMVGLYFFNMFIGSFWDSYKDLTGDAGFFSYMFAAIAFTLMFYSVAKGRRNELSNIDIDISKEEYNVKQKLKKRRSNIDGLLKND